MYEKTLSTKHVYKGRILDLDVLEVELTNGVTSMREVVRHHGAVAALCVLPDGRLVLVKQYRKAAERIFLEVVAGLIEEGEDPEDCARREIKEETGYTVDAIEKLISFYPSPGYVDETIQVYLAHLHPAADVLALDHDEHIEVVVLTREEMRRQVATGEICDGKTLVAWLLGEKRIEPDA
ncbi:MAG: NUDIX hydrolase [Spartobacteria bacterium]|nr:NUDIX hydrolase [Spartobacteria bacterium]